MKATSRLVLWLAITFLSSSLLAVQSFPTGFSTKERPEVFRAHHYAVATDDERCSKIGKDVLSEKGNAVDAAVAAALCLGVVGSASSGIGGGAFMLLRLDNGTAIAFDMRDSAPMHASENMYAGNITLKEKGPLSIAVPGELAGLYRAWSQYGKLEWERLVAPAEKLSREFKISSYLFSQMVIVESDIFADKGLSNLFTLNQRLLQTGDIVRNIKLAETLKTIAKEGIEPFYNGSIGENIIRDIQQLGGIMTMDDLRSYQVKIKKPISVNHTFGLEILGVPPPSGGVGVILMLNILAQYSNTTKFSSGVGTHRVVEALKHVFAVRTNLGDPDFVNVTSVVSDMLNPKFAKELQQTIYDYMTFDPSHYGGRWNEVHANPIREHGTSHLSIMDAYGNAVAMTTSVNYHFGSRILSPSTGILLNNQMDDFSMPSNGFIELQPRAAANFIQPGKRPLSSMSPTIILKNGKLKAVVGASGGPMIIPGVAEVILNHFVNGMDQLSSVMAPRVYHLWLPNVLQYENFISVTGDHFEVRADIKEALEERLHVLQSHDSGSICQFITKNNGLWKRPIIFQPLVAVSDPRKGGIPAGN